MSHRVRRDRTTQSLLKPPASHLLAGRLRGGCALLSYSLRVSFVFSSYSLRVLLVYSACLSPLRPRGSRPLPSVPTEVWPSLDCAGLGAMQTNSHFRKHLILAAVRRYRQTLLPLSDLPLWTDPLPSTLPCVRGLTKQEQMVLCIILGLLLTGWAVKSYRAAHPPAPAAEATQP